MAKFDYKKATFMLSVGNLTQLPPDTGAEVAFVGRSNAGKSSVLNRLTENKSLARVSKTPGRTQHINLFAIDPDHRLADLPGYGYAKVAMEVKKAWEEKLDAYLRSRDSLQGLILVMDIRHPLKPFDLQMLEWSGHSQLPLHILLNKADKLSFNTQKQTLLQTKKVIQRYGDDMSVQLFSAMNKTGLDELKDRLDGWLSI